MQPKRNTQSSFFDMAIEQRGATNRVLETIAQVVNFTEAEQPVAATYGPGWMRTKRCRMKRPSAVFVSD